MTKAELIVEFYLVKETLGRVPSEHELEMVGRFGKRAYHEHFGSHHELMQFLNEPRPVAWASPSIARVERLARLRNDQSSSQSDAHLSPATVELLAGLTGPQRDIVRAYFKVRGRLGRVLTFDEAVAGRVCDQPAFLEHFGGFASFLDCVGDRPGSPETRANS